MCEGFTMCEETTVPNSPEVIETFLSTYLRGKIPKVRKRALADVIANTAEGLIQGWSFEIRWTTSINDNESKIILYN